LDHQSLGDCGERRVGFVEPHPERRVGAVHFRDELVDAGIQSPDLGTENRKAGDHYDEYDDDDEAGATDGNLQLP
jgi:hypothetical protein